MPTLTLRRPHSAQRRIKHEARRFNVVDCGRQFGKTTLGIDLAIDGALQGWTVGFFSPTYRMLSEIWREIDLTTRPIQRARHVQDRRIELMTGGTIEFWSLDTPDVARGRRYHRLIVDEAAMLVHLEDIWNAVLRPTLLRYQGDGWFLSTPRGFNYFHTLWARGQSDEFPEWASWQMPSTENPYLAAGEIEQARRENPERVFRQEYLALFEDDAQSIFSPSWWAGERNRFVDEPWPAGHLNGRFISLDTAFKETKTAAYSAAVVGELSGWPDYRLAEREYWRDRVPFPDLVSHTMRLIERWDYDGKLIGVLIEDKASGISLVQTLQSSLPARMAGLIIAFQPPARLDKVGRASLASVRCRNGSVLRPLAAPNLAEFEAELYAAPNGEFWDWVDAYSQLILYLENYLSQGEGQRGVTLEVAA